MLGSIFKRLFVGDFSIYDIVVVEVFVKKIKGLFELMSRFGWVKFKVFFNRNDYIKTELGLFLILVLFNIVSRRICFSFTSFLLKVM